MNKATKVPKNKAAQKARAKEQIEKKRYIVVSVPVDGDVVLDAPEAYWFAYDQQTREAFECETFTDARDTVDQLNNE